MPNALAQKTYKSIELALAEERTAAITEIVQLIQQLASRAFTISVNELSQLIGRDPAITERVISTANTLGYNPTGNSISTISEAIHTVGFEKVRNLAISLMLAENAGQGTNTYEQRNIAALSVCSGMLARELRPGMLDSNEGEMIFVCASLRSYGGLLLSTFLVEDYRMARAYALQLPEEEAFKLVFGTTPEALGRKILLKTNLPKPILATLEELDPEALEKPASGLHNEILAISEMALQLCKVVFDEKVEPEGFNRALAEVLHSFGKVASIDLEQVLEMLGKIEKDIGKLNRAVGIEAAASPASAKLSARLNEQPLPEPPAYTQIDVQLKQTPVREMSEEERLKFSAATFTEAKDALKSALASTDRVNLGAVLETTAFAFKEATDLDNAFVFVREEYEPSCFTARYGLGPLFKKVKNRPVISPAKRDIFSISLVRGEDIFIEDATDPKIRSVVPDWIHLAGETGSFIILPVINGFRVQAILLGACESDRKIDLREHDLGHLRALRTDLASLYERIESGAVTLI